MKEYKKGFTILELLVVIAIIGVLASIVLVAVGNSRDKAADKAIAENLLTVRSEAALYFSATNNYGTWGNTGSPYAATTKCPSLGFTSFSGSSNLSTFKDNTVGPRQVHSDKIAEAFTEANTRSGGDVTTGGAGANRLSNTRCFAQANEWVAMVQLKTNTSKAWCVDSNGSSRIVNSSTGLSAGFDFTVGARCANS